MGKSVVVASGSFGNQFLNTLTGISQAISVKRGSLPSSNQGSIDEYGFIALMFDTEDKVFGLHSMS